MERQRTIAKEVTHEGIGLHTGNLCRLTFHPAAANTGIRFVRTDQLDHPVINAHCQNVLGVIRGTTVGNAEARVHTVEHVLSALSALGIDNILIDVNANEPPAADGSSWPFLEKLRSAGVKELDAPQEIFAPQEPVAYESGQTSFRLEPSDRLTITCRIVYSHPQISSQEVTLETDLETYGREISRARTFCFDYEVEALKKQGLARGGTLDSAVVIGLDRIHNKEKSLRYPDEFARHKVLDLLGDLTLLGCYLHGHITAVRPGHGHNINFVKRLHEKRMEQKAAARL